MPLAWPQIRPVPIMLKINFTYYSFKNFPPIVLLCLAYYSKIILKRYTCIRNTSLKILESNSWCWLQTVTNVRHDCSIRVSEHSIRVYQSFITIIIVRVFQPLFQPNNVSYMSLLEAQFFLLANQGFQLPNYSSKSQIILKLCLQPSYYSKIILTKLVTYSYNYASILGASLPQMQANSLIVLSYSAG